LFPTIGPLPVTSHTRAIRTLRYIFTAITGDQISLLAQTEPISL
jgi:hypothetical protein